MKARRTIRSGQPEKGIALLISIFVLLLISVVAISLIVSSGTETSLAGNYRSATGVNYAALAGLEEARGRLLAKNPNSFQNTDASFLPAPGSPLAIGNVYYITNPVGTEDVLAVYPDNEYVAEFKVAPNPANVKRTASVSGVGGVQGPLFKWVRINAISEPSLGFQVAPYDGHTADPAKSIFYDSTQPQGNQLTVAPTPTSAQVLEITSLAFLPNGSQKIVQYLAAPVPITLPPFLAALTLSGSQGNGVTFHAPTSNASYAVKGNDQDCSGSLTGSNYPAIGLLTNSNSDIVHVKNGIPSSYQPNYTGMISAPDVEDISGLFPASLQTPSKLDALAQSIAQYADVTIPSGPITYPLPTVTGSALTPLGMSSSNPLTVVVNGNLDIRGWSGTGSEAGYGLLLVTGTFTYDPHTAWYGMILVIGQGSVAGDHQEYQQINGAMLVAQTRDAAGNLLPDPNLGGASVVFSDSMQGNGIRYSSCWIQKAQPTSSYKILSFHEIAQ